LNRAADSNSRDAPNVCRRPAPPPFLFGRELEVEAQLFFEIAIRAPRA
jgi:hypothetical protein